VKKIAENLRSAASGRTILLVEHDMELIASLADLVCCLEEGRIADIGSPAELRSRPSLFARLLETRRAYGGQADFEVDASVPVRRVEPPGGRGAGPANAVGPGGAVAVQRAGMLK
jgi:ABC-type multidrug transport system ATPase subunit